MQRQISDVFWISREGCRHRLVSTRWVDLKEILCHFCLVHSFVNHCSVQRVKAKHICCRFLECRPPVSFSPMSHHWTLPTTPVSLTSLAQPPCIWSSPKVEYWSIIYWSRLYYKLLPDHFGYALRSLSCAPSLPQTFFILLESLAFNALMLWWGKSDSCPW